MRQHELDLVGARERDAADADGKHDLRRIVALQVDGCRGVVRRQSGVADGRDHRHIGMDVLHGTDPLKENAKGKRATGAARWMTYEVATFRSLIASKFTTPPPTRVVV
jgi:hypothetical protein